MKLPGWFAWHRWAGATAAAFLFVWLVSGVVLVLPPTEAAPPSARSRTPLPAAEMTVSPSEALMTARQGIGTAAPELRSVEFHEVGGRPVYRIVFRDGSLRLVDARTAETIEVGRELAVRIATGAYPGAPVDRVQRLESHGPTYLYGPLPAYRVVFDDGAGTWAHVAERDGGLSWTNRTRRIRAVIVAFHEFSFLPPFPGGAELRWLLLVVGVGASATVLASGAYLFVTWWIRGRRARV